MFANVKLENELVRSREAVIQEASENVLTQFQDLFVADWEKEKRLLNLIKSGASSSDLLESDLLDEQKIFSITNIKDIAVKYRLRFLSTRYFKNDIPYEAISKLKILETQTGQKISALMILAPSEMFRLEDVNKDPLLFAPLSDGRFYLIHQWGGEISWFRAILSWPTRKLQHLVGSIVILSALISLLLPTMWFGDVHAGYFNFYRVAAFGWNIIFMSGIVSYLWFVTNQKFSVNAWNSKCFN